MLLVRVGIPQLNSVPSVKDKPVACVNDWVSVTEVDTGNSIEGF